MNTIQNNLRFYRKQCGLTQREVALALGFESADQISKWENGLQYPHVVNLLKMAKLYGVCTHKLYNDENSMVNYCR